MNQTQRRYLIKRIEEEVQSIFDDRRKKRESSVSIPLSLKKNIQKINKAIAVFANEVEKLRQENPDNYVSYIMGYNGIHDLRIKPKDVYVDSKEDEINYIKQKAIDKIMFGDDEKEALEIISNLRKTLESIK